MHRFLAINAVSTGRKNQPLVNVTNIKKRLKNVCAPFFYFVLRQFSSSSFNSLSHKILKDSRVTPVFSEIIFYACTNVCNYTEFNERYKKEGEMYSREAAQIQIEAARSFLDEGGIY